jgi:hypothetical protein
VLLIKASSTSHLNTSVTAQQDPSNGQPGGMEIEPMFNFNPTPEIAPADHLQIIYQRDDTPAKYLMNAKKLGKT